MKKTLTKLFEAKEMIIILSNGNQVGLIEDVINYEYAEMFLCHTTTYGIKLKAEDCRHYRLWLASFITELYELDSVMRILI